MFSLIIMMICWPKTADKVYIEYDTSKYVIETLAVNSDGWEDSPEIDYEGKSLLYCVIPLDLGRLSRGLSNRFLPMPKYVIGGADIYLGTPNTAIPLGRPMNTPEGWEGCANRYGGTFYYSRSVNNGRALFSSDGYKESLIPLPNNKLSPNNSYDNPFKSATGMYYEKKDTIQINGKSTTVTNFYKVDNVFKNPKPMWFNSTNNETQLWCPPNESFFLFCRNHYEIWFATNGQTIPIIKTKLKPDFANEKEKNSDGSVNPDYVNRFDAIGEPSMDKDGNIYFLYVFQNGKNYEWDADILVLKRK